MKRLLLLLALGLVSLPFYAQDCPELECVQGLSLEYYPQEDGGCATILYAEDLIEMDLSSCPQPLSFAIYKQAEILAGGDSFEPVFEDSTTYTIFYLDIDGEENEEVSLFILDGNGNIHLCATNVLVYNFSCETWDICTIQGVIQTENGDGLSDVKVRLTGEVELEYNTDSTGFYSFLGISCESNYSVFPSKNINPLNGVSTFDIVLLKKHILGTQMIDSPYKLIAGDVNQSQSITTLDLIYIRRLILNYYTEFPNSPSWQFIPADYQFPVESNPWFDIIPEITTVAPNTIGLNFIAIKTGDVNSSASTE